MLYFPDRSSQRKEKRMQTCSPPDNWWVRGAGILGLWTWSALIERKMNYSLTQRHGTEHEKKRMTHYEFFPSSMFCKNGRVKVLGRFE